MASVVELVPSRLYVMGGSIALDERISWAPKGADVVQPLNCYLLREDDASMIIDPGPACFEDLLVEQLGSVLPPGSPVTVYVTRPEFDTFGSLNKLAQFYKIEHLYAGGHTNPFDAFDHLTTVDPSRRSEHVELARVAGGSDIAVGGARAITMVRPAIRVLVTYWAYDKLTGTLFTSDAFSHGTMREATDSRVIRDADTGDVETVRRHLFAKFWWLAHAGVNAKLVADNLREIFDRYDIQIIAPSRGAVICGREAVRHHHNLIQEVLAGVSEAATNAVQAAITTAGS